MSHHLLRRVATVLTALGMTGLVDPVGYPTEPDPCGANGGVSIDDFIMWDSPGVGSAHVPVRSAAPCAVARTITYSTYDITARAGEDYVGVSSGTFVFPAGVTSTTVTIQIIGDDTPEPAEYFGIRLHSGARLDDPEAVVTLKDR